MEAANSDHILWPRRREKGDRRTPRHETHGSTRAVRGQRETENESSFGAAASGIASSPVRRRPLFYSHSIVPGGLLDTSYTARLMPFTSFTIRFAMRASTSYGSRAQSAVMPSLEVTQRIAMHSW